MRHAFSKTVERGRIQHGQFASSPGEQLGAFEIKHPKTMRKFVVIASNELGWDHVSARPSHHNRTPTWEEMSWIKDLFFDPDECVVQYHPAVKDYVNIHPNVLHMWRPQGELIPMPPEEMV